MDGISRSRGWDKQIPHGVLPMEQLVLSDKWARKFDTLPIQCRHIEHMHGGVCFRKNIF